ncbi:MAG: hypothetical protein ACXVB8_23205, partial [Bdellovibrionota bacterium]
MTSPRPYLSNPRPPVLREKTLLSACAYPRAQLRPPPLITAAPDHAHSRVPRSASFPPHAPDLPQLLVRFAQPAAKCLKQ